jgi:hypothetical protein
MSRPSGITVSRSKRGTTVKATGTAARAVFDALATHVDARLDPAQPGPHTVHFEDHGQDFLEWDIDAKGVVVASRPCQAWAWVGCTLVGEAKVGERLRYQSPDGMQHSPVYPVDRVVQKLSP